MIILFIFLVLYELGVVRLTKRQIKWLIVIGSIALIVEVIQILALWISI